MLKRARAFSPAGISSFFEIYDRTPEGTLITSLERVGARGGGFVIEKGVLTEVSITESEKPSTEVYINNKLFPEADHGIIIAKTGCMKEQRERYRSSYAPGYIELMQNWLDSLN